MQPQAFGHMGLSEYTPADVEVRAHRLEPGTGTGTGPGDPPPLPARWAGRFQP